MKDGADGELEKGGIKNANGPGSVKMVGGMRTFSTGGGQGVPAVEMDQDEMLLRVR